MNPSPPHAAAAAAAADAPPVTHYENFPVASWLCPARLRAPIAAIYTFARTADDIADEGDAPPEARLAGLASYRQALQAAGAGRACGRAWPEVFGPLQRQILTWELPPALLHALLDAFEQDVRMTRDGTHFADRAQLLAYCARSANPVGRLLLHLYAVHDPEAQRQSDAICSALQLINFWQDLSVDLPRARHYVTDADCARFGVARAQLARQERTPASDALVLDCAAWARQLMQEGAPLAQRLPGRIGWELRLVVQGALTVLAKVERLAGASLLKRPRVRAWDAPRIAWSALRMGSGRVIRVCNQ